MIADSDTVNDWNGSVSSAGANILELIRTLPNQLAATDCFQAYAERLEEDSFQANCSASGPSSKECCGLLSILDDVLGSRSLGDDRRIRSTLVVRTISTAL